MPRSPKKTASIAPAFVEFDSLHKFHGVTKRGGETAVVWIGPRSTAAFLISGTSAAEGDRPPCRLLLYIAREKEKLNEEKEACTNTRFHTRVIHTHKKNNHTEEITKKHTHTHTHTQRVAEAHRADLFGSLVFFVQPFHDAGRSRCTHTKAAPNNADGVSPKARA